MVGGELVRDVHVCGYVVERNADRWRRALKYVGVLVGVLVGVAALLLVGTGIWLKTDSGRSYLRRQIVARATRSLNGAVSIGKLSGSVLSGIRLDNIRIVDQSQRQVARAESVSLQYHLWNLLFGRTQDISRVVLRHPEVWLVTRPDGRMDIKALLKPSPAGPPAAMAFHDIVIEEGRLSWSRRSGPVSIAHLNVSGNATIGSESQVTVRAAHALATLGGKIRPIAAAGRMRSTRDGLLAEGIKLRVGDSEVVVAGALGRAETSDNRPVHVELRRASIAPAELRLLAPPLRARGAILVEGHDRGTLGRNVIDARVTLPAGQAVVSSVVSTASARPAGLQLSSTEITLNQVDVSAFSPDTPLVVSGRIDLHGALGGGMIDGEATAREGTGRYRDVPFSDLNGQVVMAQRAARIERFAFDVPGAHVLGHGDVTLDGRVVIAFEVHVADAEQLSKLEGWQRLLEATGPLAQMVTLRGQITKAPDQRTKISVVPLASGATAVRGVSRAIQKLPGELEKIPGTLGKLPGKPHL